MSNRCFINECICICLFVCFEPMFALSARHFILRCLRHLLLPIGAISPIHRTLTDYQFGRPWRKTSSRSLSFQKSGLAIRIFAQNALANQRNFSEQRNENPSAKSNNLNSPPDIDKSDLTHHCFVQCSIMSILLSKRLRHSRRECLLISFSRKVAPTHTHTN